MGEHRLIFWLNVIIGPLLGGFAAYWVAASVLAEYSWCIAGEEHCVREWVAALSGWAAAFAAGATILFLRWEHGRRDLLEWRVIVNSAELLRGKLLPQVNQLFMAVRHEPNAQTTQWLIPCLERIQAAILDPGNQEFRKASVKVAASCDTALHTIGDSIRLVKSNWDEALTPNNMVINTLSLTHEFLERFLQELEDVVANARTPRDYRGV